MTHRVLDLFSAAAGGWSLGMHRAGFTTIAACECEAWRRALYQENNPHVRIYDDVRTLTADRILRDCGCLPDYIVGSPPCQDISSANTKGKGVEGERSGLYFEAIRIIGECRPRGFALENSANLRTRGADAVLAALEAVGYACWPYVVGAGDIGANHERKRSWLIGFDLDQVTNAGSWEQREQSGRRDGPNWSGPSFNGYDDQTEHDGNTDGQRRAQRISASTNEGSDAFGPGRLRPVANCERNGALHDVDPESLGHEGGRAWRHGQDGDGASSTSPSPRNAAHADEAGQEAGLQESSLRQAQEPEHGCGDGRRDDGQSVVEVAGSEDIGINPPEPWSDWNRGLTGHLRVDDGLSAWVAGTRVAVGGPKGTSAASLIVEAFGDAVVPQIPEAIGRAILRTEAALCAIYGRNAA